MKKTLRILTESHKEDIFCLNSETSVFIYYQGSSTVKNERQGKLYLYVVNCTSDEIVRDVRAHM